MLTSCFDYDLPDECIARHPTEQRDGARMLVVESGGFYDDWVKNFSERVGEGSMLVVNDTRVRRARLIGRRRDSGGRVELLMLMRVERLSESRTETWVALGRPSRRLHPGVCIEADGMVARIVEREAGGQVVVEVETESGCSVEAALERHGHVPIPPYLGRADEQNDVVRYQTVYAKHHGSVAAPTAGLHLTQRSLDVLRSRGVDVGSVTLHVGIGTFRPVAVADLDDHPMHSEWFEVSPDVAQRIDVVRRRGGKVIAVGTTAVRALESAADTTRFGHVNPMVGNTQLLIQPGYRFRVVDGLLTNFHQPRSTLLALVGAAIGIDRLREAYRVALESGYRFLSYGDAMWIPELIA